MARQPAEVVFGKLITAYVIAWLIFRLLYWAVMGFRGPPLGRIRSTAELQRELKRQRDKEKP
jgi:hypothetical protein